MRFLKIDRWVLVLVLGLLGCAPCRNVLVLCDRPGSLKSGGRGLWENQTIGSVGEFQANPSGKTVVPLRVKPDFRQALTDQSRFFIQSDPDRPESQSVKMHLLGSGGKPLPDGAVVEGSTPFSYLIEKGSREAQALPRLIQDGLDLLAKELSRLSEREWQRELERQIEAWTRELQRSGEEARRYFQREILPNLEKVVQDFLRRLKELGRELEGKPLEEKLERLKKILQS